MFSQYDYWWIWCLLLVVGFGGCIGSFINVVIYRLARDIPLDNPRWSFCPNCKTPIKWYDNIPVISYFLLGARCRACQGNISPRYVIVEVMTIVAFLILFDAFFVGNVLSGIRGNPWSIAYRFYEDWPIFAAHAILFSCLLAMSAVDMELYWVDIRFTHLAAFSGFLFHAVWAPIRVPPWPRTGPTLSGAAILATIGCLAIYLVSSWYWRRRTRTEKVQALGSSSEPAAESSQPPASAGADTSDLETTLNANAAAEAPETIASQAPAKTFPPSAWLAGLMLYMLLAILVLTMLHHKEIRNAPDATFAIRILPGLLFIFVVMMAGSVIRRESDQAIEHAVEAERHAARRGALKEFGMVLIPIALFVSGLLLVGPNGLWHDAWREAWDWSIGRSTRPLIGLGTAATGFIVASAVGWAVRIVFTWVLGKEAFGTGDIHIMAAAGAVAGWQVVVVGFFLSSLLALLGWVLTLPFKRGRMLPMGPWLTLGIFIVVLMRDPAIEHIVKPTEDVIKWLLA